MPNLRHQPRICLQILRNIIQQVSESRLENKTLRIFNANGDNSTVSFGYYSHQVTALTAVFLKVEEYAALIFRAKGNIKAASSYKTGV